MRTIEWDNQEDCIVIIDQTRLPEEVERYQVRTVDDLTESIQCLRVRGAPALGAAGAYGVALATREHSADTVSDLLNKVEKDAERIALARPTAVNLSSGVESVMEEARKSSSVESMRERTLQCAEELADEDVRTNRQIGELGADLLESGQTVMTHCNAGSFATVDWGTALGIVYSAQEQEKDVRVITNETRPLNQGSRITAAELLDRNVETVLIPDNASGLCIQNGEVDAVIVGADRIVLDGGEPFNHHAVVYNKIGTYKHAVLADRHDVPFIVAAPTSTIDEENSAEEVEIEERDDEELKEIYGEPNAPQDVDVYNPAFDPTPEELVDYLVTEKGVFEPPLTYQKIFDDE